MNQLLLINYAIYFFAALIILVVAFIFIRRAVLFPFQRFYKHQLAKYLHSIDKRLAACRGQKVCVIEPIKVFWSWEKLALEENALLIMDMLDRQKDIYLLVRILEISGIVTWRIKQLNSWSTWTRRIAADRLGKSLSFQAITQLLLALRDRDEDVRFIAAKGLGKVKAAGAIPYLVSLLESFRPEKCPVIADILIDYGFKALPTIILVLPKASPKTAYWLLRTLLEIPFSSKYQKDKILWKSLNDLLRSSEARLRGYAVQVLSKMSQANLPKIITKMFLDDSVFVRKCTAEALGRLGNLASAKALVVVLRDPDLEVRLSATEALHKYGKRIVPLVQKVFTKKREPAADHAREILQEMVFK